MTCAFLPLREKRPIRRPQSLVGSVRHGAAAPITGARTKRPGQAPEITASAPDLVAEPDQSREVVDVRVEVGDLGDDIGNRGQLGSDLRLTVGNDLEVEEAVADLTQDPLEHGGVVSFG